MPKAILKFTAKTIECFVVFLAEQRDGMGMPSRCLLFAAAGEAGTDRGVKQPVAICEPLADGGRGLLMPAGQGVLRWDLH